MDRMNQKKVLFTGCAGFIGSNLCGRLCDEGYKVVGIDNLSAGTLENIDNRVIFHKGGYQGYADNIDTGDFGIISGQYDEREHRLFSSLIIKF